MRILVDRFDGMVPQLGDRQLGHTQARLSQNARLWTGEVRPFKAGAGQVEPHIADAISMYLLNGTWLAWNVAVDVARAPLFNDAFNRLYYTGDKNPKLTTDDLAVTSGPPYPKTFYRLGWPWPSAALTIGSVTGGGAPTVNRTYLYCFYSEHKELGPPSDTSVAVTGNQDGSWNLTGIGVAPLNQLTISAITHSAGKATITFTTDHHVEEKEYLTFASIVGAVELNGLTLAVTDVVDATNVKVTLAAMTAYISGGTADREAPLNLSNLKKWIFRADAGGNFRFVAEIAVATTTYADTIADTALGIQLPTFDYIAPPGDMFGLCPLRNGIMVALSGNSVCFSEPYQPHAWPEEYRVALDEEAIGCGVWGSSVVVGTKSRPSLITGPHPELMSEETLDYNQSAISGRGFIGLETGVTYPSPNGLVFVGAGGVRLLTESLLEKPDWDLYNPASLIGTTYDDRYIGFYSSGGENSDEQAALVVDPAEPTAAFFHLTLKAQAVFHDRELDELYYLDAADGLIKLFEGLASDLQAYWRSKRYVLPQKTRLTVGKVRWTANAALTAAEAAAALAAAIQAVDDALLATGDPLYSGATMGSYPAQYPVMGGPYVDAIKANLSAGSGVTIHIWCQRRSPTSGDLEDYLIHTETPVDSEAFRFPDAEGKIDEWWFEVSTSQAVVHEVVLADTPSELATA